MGGKPASNVDAATSKATVLYMPWSSYRLADFPAWPRRNRIWREAGYRLMQEVKFRLVNPSPRAAAGQAPCLRRDLSFHVVGGQGSRAGMTRTARCGTARHCKRDSGSSGFGASSGTWKRPRRYADEGAAINNFSPGLWTCATLYAAVGLIGIFFLASRPSIATSSDGYGIVAIAPPPTLR